ncbi:unnamed protein product [Rhizophagus irregularis]|nr:unnamed protein product [Rhizophagus irregularis]
MSSHRYAKANNPQCLDYESSKPNSWIMYEDMNALYSGTMTQYMPTEILGKVDPEEVPDIQSIVPDADIGTGRTDVIVTKFAWNFSGKLRIIPVN